MSKEKNIHDMEDGNLEIVLGSAGFGFTHVIIVKAGEYITGLATNIAPHGGESPPSGDDDDIDDRVFITLRFSTAELKVAVREEREKEKKWKSPNGVVTQGIKEEERNDSVEKRREIEEGDDVVLEDAVRNQSDVHPKQVRLDAEGLIQLDVDPIRADLAVGATDPVRRSVRTRAKPSQLKDYVIG